MVPGTTRKKLLFTALLVTAFALGFAIAVSMWEGGWGVDDGSDSSESANRVLHNDSVLAAGGMGFLEVSTPIAISERARHEKLLCTMVVGFRTVIRESPLLQN